MPMTYIPLAQGIPPQITNLEDLQNKAPVLPSDDKGQPTPNQHPGGTSTSQGMPTQNWSPQLVTNLSLGLLFFGICMMAMISSLIFKDKVKPPEGDGQWLMRLIVVPTCVLAAVFLILVGYTDVQINSAIGFMGTVIGYLLGAGTRPNVTASEPNKPPHPPSPPQPQPQPPVE